MVYRRRSKRTSDEKRKRPSTVEARKAKSPATVPNRFVPRFFDEMDGRQYATKAIVERYETLRNDIGSDSSQKDILIQRAVFLSVVLETLEVQAINEGTFEKLGVWIQGANALTGLLSKLGLERQMTKVTTLDEIKKKYKSS